MLSSQCPLCFPSLCDSVVNLFTTEATEYCTEFHREIKSITILF